LQRQNERRSIATDDQCSTAAKEFGEWFRSDFRFLMRREGCTPIGNRRYAQSASAVEKADEDQKESSDSE